MSKIPMDPGTVHMAEVLTRQRALEHAAAIVTAMNSAKDYAEILASHPAHGEYARARMKIYDAMRDKIEQLFVAMESSLGEAHAKANADLETDMNASGSTAAPPPGSRAEQLARAAAARGDGGVVLCCPQCQTGRHVAPDGMCAACGSPASDTRAMGNDPPWPPPPPTMPALEDSDLPPGVVRIQKRAR